jgi:serine/threonine protein kinase
MLVMNTMHLNLRDYMQQNHNNLTWKRRIQIALDIIQALNIIHGENAIHRDLHSGNILYHQINQEFFISDLGFCGPANKPLNSIYGNLPYIAPEVIVGKETTFASDIYSIGMLMWEISSGQPPFAYFVNDYDLATRIINGMRPKIVLGTPLEYRNLMNQCWDADPKKRPNINRLFNEICEIRRLYQNTTETDNTSKINEINCTNSRLFTSKIHKFESFPEPRNATEGMMLNQ